MATRKRRATRRRRSVARAHNPINPTRRRRTRRTRRAGVFARRRNPINPTRRRRSGRRRHRNPLTGRVVFEGFKLAAAGAVIGIAQPFVRNLVGPYLGTSPIASAGVTLLTGYGLSFIAKFIPFTRKYEDTILLAAATIAGAQVLSAYVQPYLKLGGSNPLMSAPRGYRRGMRGIGIATGVPPQLVPAPPPPPTNGMQGMGVRTGAWGY